MKLFARYLLLIIILTLLTYFTLQALVAHYRWQLVSDIDKICLLHFFLSVFVLSSIWATNVVTAKHTAFAFLATALFRMGGIIAFVIPLARKTTETPITDTLFVVIPYFIFTIVEAHFTIKLIKQQPSNQPPHSSS